MSFWGVRRSRPAGNQKKMNRFKFTSSIETVGTRQKHAKTSFCIILTAFPPKNLNKRKHHGKICTEKNGTKNNHSRIALCGKHLCMARGVLRWPPCDSPPAARWCASACTHRCRCCPTWPPGCTGRRGASPQPSPPPSWARPQNCVLGLIQWVSHLMGFSYLVPDPKDLEADHQAQHKYVFVGIFINYMTSCAAHSAQNFHSQKWIKTDCISYVGRLFCQSLIPEQGDFLPANNLQSAVPILSLIHGEGIPLSCTTKELIQGQDIPLSWTRKEQPFATRECSWTCSTWKFMGCGGGWSKWGQWVGGVI